MISKSIVRYLQSIESRCRYSGLHYTLGAQWFTSTWDKQEGRCAYSGMKMLAPGSSRRNPRLCSIDRLDPRRGYTIDNAVLCCWCINAFKGSMSTAEFGEVLRELVYFRLAQHTKATSTFPRCGSPPGP